MKKTKTTNPCLTTAPLKRSELRRRVWWSGGLVVWWSGGLGSRIWTLDFEI